MGILYDNISRLCNERNISISKLLLDLGYSKSLGTSLKQGQDTMNSDRLLAIADYLGVSVDELLRAEDEEDNSRYYQFWNGDRWLEVRIRAIKGLSENEREIVQSHVDTLSKTLEKMNGREVTER